MDKLDKFKDMVAQAEYKKNWSKLTESERLDLIAKHRGQFYSLKRAKG